MICGCLSGPNDTCNHMEPTTVDMDNAIARALGREPDQRYSLDEMPYGLGWEFGVAGGGWYAWFDAKGCPAHPTNPEWHEIYGVPQPANVTSPAEARRVIYAAIGEWAP